MATPKKPRNNTTKVKSTRVEQEKSGVGRIIATIAAALIVVGAVGYFILDINPFASNDTVTSSDEVKVESDEKKDTDGSERAEKFEKLVRAALVKAAAGEYVETVASETEKTYVFIAGTGESFSALARRAIASTDSELSTAERIAAETRLTQEAGAENLDVAQQLSLEKSDVAEAIEWAEGLSAEEKAAWQYYADMVAW